MVILNWLNIRVTREENHVETNDVIIIVTAIMILGAIAVELKILCKRIRTLREEVKLARQVIQLLEQKLTGQFDDED